MADDNVLQENSELAAEDRITAAFYKAKDRPWVLDRLGKLAAAGDDLGASPEDTASAIEAYN